MKKETLHTIFAIAGLISFFTAIVSLLFWIWAGWFAGKICITSIIIFFVCALFDDKLEDREARMLKEILNDNSLQKSPFAKRLDELALKKQQEKQKQDEK